MPERNERGAETHAELSEVVGRMHAAGLYHMDLRGRDNVLIGVDGRVVCHRPGRGRSGSDREGGPTGWFSGVFSATDRTALIKWKWILGLGSPSGDDKVVWDRHQVLAFPVALQPQVDGSSAVPLGAWRVVALAGHDLEPSSRGFHFDRSATFRSAWCWSRCRRSSTGASGRRRSRRRPGEAWPRSSDITARPPVVIGQSARAARPARSIGRRSSGRSDWPSGG